MIPKVFVGIAFFCLFVIVPVTAEAEHSAAEPEYSGFLDWLDRDEVRFFGTTEVELRSEQTFDDSGNRESKTFESTLSLELGLAVQPSSWLGGTLEIDWDEDSPVEINEAWLKLGNPERFPLYFSGGKMTLPFGLYESAMISDPVTLELGETKSEAVLLGLEWRDLYLKFFSYNGSSRYTDEDDGLRSYGGDAGYRFEGEDSGLLVGASWISNLEDSDNLSEHLKDEELLLKDQVPGIAVYALLNWGPLSLTGEYVESLEYPKFLEENEIFEGDRQKAWSGELVFDFDLESIELETGLMYGETAGARDLLPKKRFGGVLTICPFEYFSVAVELVREKDYPVSQGGTDNYANIVTFQLTAEIRN